MICPKCGKKSVAEESISYQMECRNHLFCFEDVPAPRCSECGHVSISQEAMGVMLAKIDQLTQKATISYHRCRWPKAQQCDDPSGVISEEMVETVNKSARK